MAGQVLTKRAMNAATKAATTHFPPAYLKLMKNTVPAEQPFFVAGDVWTINNGGTRFYKGARPGLANMTTSNKIACFAAANNRIMAHRGTFEGMGIQLEGIRGIEMHYPNEINKDNIRSITNAFKATGLIPSLVTANLFYTFSDGALSSTNPVERERAIQYVKAAIDYAYAFEKIFNFLPMVVLWPGGDGWNCAFERDPAFAIHLYADAVNQIFEYDKAKHGGRIRIAGEAKPNEPKCKILIPTTDSFLALIHLIKPEFQNRFGVNPETAHEMLANLSPVQAIMMAIALGKLFHYHSNWQEGLKWDQDKAVPLNLAMLEVIHLMQKYGFKGSIGLDVQARPESKDVLAVVKNSVINLRILEALAQRIDWNVINSLRAQQKYEEIEQYMSLFMLQAIPKNVDIRKLV